MEARLQSLDQKADNAAVYCTTQMMNGPSDEELIKMMLQSEMSKKTEKRDTESRKRNIVIYRYRVREKTTQNVSERKTNMNLML